VAACKFNGVLFLDQYDEEGMAAGEKRERMDSASSGSGSLVTLASSGCIHNGSRGYTVQQRRKPNGPMNNENWRRVNQWRRNFARIVTSDRTGVGGRWEEGVRSLHSNIITCRCPLTAPSRGPTPNSLMFSWLSWVSH